MERLNHIIQEAVAKREWKPIAASRGQPLLSNLFFADDLVLFGEATKDQAGVIKNCLERFCQALG